MAKRDPIIALAKAIRALERGPFGWELTRRRLLNHKALRNVTDGR
jgi:hypothetical protein